jgi:hypothetical protein
MINRPAQFYILLVVEAWMSKNVDLLFRGVHREKDPIDEAYDSVKNLKMEIYNRGHIFPYTHFDWNGFRPISSKTIA